MLAVLIGLVSSGRSVFSVSHLFTYPSFRVYVWALTIQSARVNLIYETKKYLHSSFFDDFYFTQRDYLVPNGKLIDLTEVKVIQKRKRQPESSDDELVEWGRKFNQCAIRTCEQRVTSAKETFKSSLIFYQQNLCRVDTRYSNIPTSNQLLNFLSNFRSS